MGVGVCRSVPDRVGGGAGDATADAASAATGGVDNKSALSEMLLEAEGRNKVRVCVCAVLSNE